MAASGRRVVEISLRSRDRIENPTWLSCDQIDRAGPGLMAVGLGDAQIDRQVGAAWKPHGVLERDAPAPVGLRQPIDAEPAAETAAVEGERAVGERGEIDLA